MLLLVLCHNFYLLLLFNFHYLFMFILIFILRIDFFVHLLLLFNFGNLLSNSHFVAF